MQSSSPSVEWRRDNAVARIVLRGEFDISMCPSLRAVFRDAILAAPQALDVDIRDLTFVDSTAVSVIVAAHRRARASGMDWHMHGANRDVRRVLAVMRLDGILLTEHAAPQTA